MSQDLFDFPSRLRPAPSRYGLEPFLGRLVLTLTVALIPMSVFFVSGSILGEPGEAGSMLAMLAAMTAASFAMQQAMRSRLRFRAQRGPSIRKTVSMAGDRLGDVPDCDLAAMGLAMFDEPGLALSQAANLARAALRIAAAILILAPAGMVWEMLTFDVAALGVRAGDAAASSPVTITNGDLATFETVFRTLLAFNIWLVVLGALAMLLSGFRFGLCNKYRERSDARLREHFGVAGTGILTISTCLPSVARPDAST